MTLAEMSAYERHRCREAYLKFMEVAGKEPMEYPPDIDYINETNKWYVTYPITLIIVAYAVSLIEKIW